MGVLDSGTINAWEESRGRSRVSFSLLNNQRRHRANAFLNCKTLALLWPSFSVWLIFKFTQCFMDNYYGYHGNSTNLLSSHRRLLDGKYKTRTPHKTTLQYIFSKLVHNRLKGRQNRFGDNNPFRHKSVAHACPGTGHPMTKVPTYSCSIAQTSWNKRRPTIDWFPPANSNLSGQHVAACWQTAWKQWGTWGRTLWGAVAGCQLNQGHLDWAKGARVSANLLINKQHNWPVTKLYHGPSLTVLPIECPSRHVLSHWL